MIDLWLQRISYPMLLQAELQRPRRIQECIQLKVLSYGPERHESGYCGQIESAKLQCYSSSFKPIAWSPCASSQPRLAVPTASVSKAASSLNSSSACFAFLFGRSLVASVLAGALRLWDPAAAGAVFSLAWPDVTEAVVIGGALMVAVPSLPLSNALLSLPNF